MHLSRIHTDEQIVTITARLGDAVERGLRVAEGGAAGWGGGVLEDACEDDVSSGD